MDHSADSSPFQSLLSADWLLDTMPWGILVVDEQHIVRRANQQAARWGDVVPAALLGQPVAEAPLPPGVRAALAQLLASPSLGPIEVVLPASERWITCDATRQPGGWVVYGQDITPQKQREQQYQALAENTPDVLTRWTPDLRLRYANAALAAKVGAPLAALLHKTKREMGLPEAVAGPYMAALQRVFDTGQPQELYHPLPTPQGNLAYHSRLVPELRDGQIETVLGIAHDLTELHQTQAEALRLRDALTQQATDKYHALFQRMNQGFCVLEILFDAAEQRAVGFNALEVNPRFAQELGMAAYATGDTLRELVPALDDFWLAAYGQVVRTGEAQHLERYEPQVSRWFEVHIFRIGLPAAHQVAVLFSDITARKQAEQRQQYVMQLADALRPLTDPLAIQREALAVLRAHLGGTRTLYAEALDQEGTMYISTEDRDPGLEPMEGLVMRFQDFTPDGLAEAKAGHPLWRSDVLNEAYTPEQQAGNAAFGTRAWLMVPLVKNGCLVADLTVHSATARTWTAYDIALVQETTERTWAAVERARAEEALRQSEKKYRLLFTNMSEGFALGEMQWDEAGNPVDWRYLEVNQAWEQTGVPVEQTVRRTAREVNPDIEPDWIATYGRVVQTGEPAAYEAYAAGFGKWFDTFAFKHSTNCFGLLFRDISSRKQAEEALRRSEEKYRTLFDSIDEGFSIIEMIFDKNGEAVDYRFLEVNQSYERITGQQNPTGKLVSEVAPATESYWFEEYGRVAQTGEPLRFEHYHEDTGRWYSGYAARIGCAGSCEVAVVFNDITERKQREQQQQFLIKFSDALRAEPDADAIANQAVQLLAEHLRLDRCYIEIALFNDNCGIFPYQFGNDRVAPMPEGGVSLSAFPEALRKTFDETLVITDFQHTADLTKTEKQHFAALGFGALVIANVRKEEKKPDWSINAVSATPRRWTDVEIRLIEEITERTWAAVERAKAEEALRASEATLAAVFDVLPVGIGLADTHGRLTLANHQMRRYLPTGIMPSRDETQQRRWYAERSDGSPLPPTEFPGARAQRGEKVVPGIEMLHTPAEGLPLWTQVFAVPLQYHHDQVVGHVTVILDIDAHKRTEQALRASEAQLAELNTQLEQRVARRTQQLQASRDLLQSVLDTSLISMSVLYAVRDEAGQVLDFRLGLVNKKLEHDTGRTDLVGKLYAQEYPGIRQVGIFDLMLRALATNEPQGMEYFYDREGFNRWYTCQFVKMGDGVVATNLDITERKLAEQERLKNLRLLEQAEAVAGLGSWDYDLATGRMRWSDGMYHLVGLPLDQPVSPEVYLQFVVDDDRPRAEQLVHQLISGRSVEETLRLRVGEHLKTVRLKAVVLRNETGQAARVLGVDLDISELQRLEADNLRLRLGQQQALFEAVQEAQEEERRRISENLHNGIGQILYATKLQLDRLPDAPELSPRHRAAELLSEAIRQTRALSHELTPATLEEFGLEATLRGMCRMLNTPALQWHCHFDFEESSPLAMPLQLVLYRLAQELAQNVLKHAQATEATLEVEILPDWAVLRVEDNGRGFDLATSSDGLGLRTLRSRVALLRGRLHLTSTLGQGTQCQIRLPLTPTLA